MIVGLTVTESGIEKALSLQL